MAQQGTRRLTRAEGSKPNSFLAHSRASLVVLEGSAVGTEYALERERVSIGRGLEADIVLADDATSKQHAAFELGEDGYQVRDLGSTNGLFVNGARIVASDLKHGDRVRLGEHTLQYVVEAQPRVATYDLSEEM